VDGEYPDAIARFVARLHEFNLGILRAQIKAAAGRLAGIIIWGDVAYKKGMLFSPTFWRQHFKPGVKAMIDECHSHGLPVIYHGCGNVSRIFEDFIEIGVDAYNPLEYKAGLDAVELRRRLGHRLGFCGNMDVQLWGCGHERRVACSCAHQAERGKGGGFIFQSDHSVPSNVSGESYDYVVRASARTRRLPAPTRRVRFARPGLKISQGGPLKRYGMVIGLKPKTRTEI